MRYRKFLSFLISIVLVVSTLFSVSFADGTDSGRTCTTSTGITMTVPAGFTNVLWTGMDEGDPLLKDMGIDKEEIMKWYRLGGTEIQFSKYVEGSSSWFFVIMFEKKTPSNLNASFSENIQPMTPGSFGNTEAFGYGMVEKAGIPFYKISFQTSGTPGNPGDTVLRMNQYSLITGSGKMHQLNIMMMGDRENKTGPVPYTDDECRQLEEASNSIINSIKLSDELASDVITPEGAEPFKMVQGESFDGGRSYTLTSGITVSLPTEFAVLWDGMKEDDPVLKEQNVDFSVVTSEYKQCGRELGAGDVRGTHAYRTDKERFLVAVFENDSPSFLTESSLSSNFPNNLEDYYPGSFSTTELFGYGTVVVNGISFFKVFYQNSGTASAEKVRLYQYSFNTANGKTYQICIVLSSTESPFSEKSCEYLDYLAGNIINSVKLSDGLAGQVKATNIEPYKMVTGDYAQAENVEAGNSNASSDQTGEKTSAASTPAMGQTFSLYKSVTSWNIPMFVILIALALLLLVGIKPSKLREWQEEPLSLDNSKAIQGFAAVAIIVHHLSQELAQEAGVIGIFEGLGVLFVGIFFFFSGYGLYTSLKTKENYLKGFLKKRYVTILIPFYICILVFVVAACICGIKFTPLQLLAVLSGWSLINQHMWYIVEIAILYIVFYIVYKLIKNRTAATIVMGVFVLVMMAGSLMLCHGKDMSCSYWFQGEWWYNASILFVVGIIVSKHSDLLRKIARKGYIIWLPIFGALTYLFGRQTAYMLKKYSYWSEIPGENPAYMDKLRCLSVQVPFILFFVLFVLLVMMKFRFGNPVLKFLGTVSLELYLIHNLFLNGFSNGVIFKIASPSMYIIFTIMFSIGAAAVISGVDKYLIAMINGKIKKRETGSSRIASVDVMRFVMAFLVVAIHCPFAGKAGDVFITYGKTAVPFFLVICGYMLYRDDVSLMMKRLIKQTKRILVLYVASNVFYALAKALYNKMTLGNFDISDSFTSKAIKDFLLYNFSPFSEHLWYLGSLLYALVVLLVLNKLKIVKYVVFAGPVLIAAYVALSHMGIGEGYQLRNAVLVGLGYTLTGMLIRRFEKKILSVKALPVILGALGVTAVVTAMVELNTYKQGTAVPFISCEVLTIIIVLLCLRFQDIGFGTAAEKLGRTTTLTIYIMHMFVLMLFVMTKNDAFFGKFGAVCVFAVTAVAAWIYASIKQAVISSKAAT